MARKNDGVFAEEMTYSIILATQPGNGFYYFGFIHMTGKFTQKKEAQ